MTAALACTCRLEHALRWLDLAAESALRDGDGAYLVANIEHFLAVVRRHQAVAP